MALDLPVHELEELALERTDVLGLDSLAERGRARKIREQHRDDASLLVLRDDRLRVAPRPGATRRRRSRTQPPQPAPRRMRDM